MKAAEAASPDTPSAMARLMRGKLLAALETTRQLSARLPVRLEVSLIRGDDVAAKARLDVQDELLERERRGRDVLGPRLLPRRLSERGDSEDEGKEDADDEDSQDRARGHHPGLQGE